MPFLKRHTSMACLLAVALSAVAAPANPGVVTIRQPDGQDFKARMHGDERRNWVETIDGYTVVKNKATGYFEYAIKGPGGLVPSGVVVTSKKLADVPEEKRPPKGLRP